MLVLTSWDDGHPCDERVANLLAKHDLAGTFFVPVTNGEGKEVMNVAQLRHLDQGFEIGGHTLTHCYLSGKIKNEIAITEVNEGKKIIEDHIGHGLSGFCYPGGRYNDHIVQIVKNAGFEYARTTENLRFDLGVDCWRIPTTVQFFPHKAAVLTRNTLRYPAFSKLQMIASRIIQKDFVSYLLKAADQCARKNGVFHVWGHSWEIEQNNLWSDLELLLKNLAGMATRSITLKEAAASMKVKPI